MVGYILCPHSDKQRPEIRVLDRANKYRNSQYYRTCHDNNIKLEYQYYYYY